MALEVELSEAWVRRQPALQGVEPEQVESLSLQGTFAGKIISLGNALKSFKNLRSLDLSKNQLVILEGLECLQSLEHLNLYYNNISSLLEITRLQTLPRLRELDLRLNPLTRNESDYRLFTVCRLRNLEKLDDRTVRESEREAAYLHFHLQNKEKEKPSKAHAYITLKSKAMIASVVTINVQTVGNTEQSKGERKKSAERECGRLSEKLPKAESIQDRGKCKQQTMRSQVPDEETFAVRNLTTENGRINTESSLSHLTHHHQMHYQDGNDSVGASSMLHHCKAAKEGKLRNFQSQLEDVKGRQFPIPNLTDNECKPLSSPPQARATLRSQVRSRAGLGKGRARVSFSEGASMDSSRGEQEAGQKLDILDRGRDVSPSRRLNLNDVGTSRALRVDHREHPPLPSSAADHRELLNRLQSDRKTMDKVGNCASRYSSETLAASRSSCGDFNLGQRLETDSDHTSPLKLCSDSKRSNHCVSLSSRSATSLEDFLSKRCPVSSEVPLETSQPVSAPASLSRKGQEPPASWSLSPSKVALKHNNDPQALGSPKRCFKEQMEHWSREMRSGHIAAAESAFNSTDKGSPLVIVLRQLLDLVDRYWSGSGSLLTNKDFLAPARDLLMYLMSAASSQQEAYSVGFHSRLRKDQPKYSSLFNGINKSVKTEDSQAPFLKETAALSHYSPHGKYSLSYDELLSSNGKLTAQLDAVTSELKQLQKQQETLSLLRESQKSLVSTNNFLLQQLAKQPGPPLMPVLPSSSSEKMATQRGGAPSFCKRTGEPVPFDSSLDSRQQCVAEHLSSCPL